MPDQRTIWKRRAVLMAVIGLIVAAPVTIAVRGGDEGEDGPAGAEPQLPRVGALKFDRNLGFELRLPDGWKRDRKRGVVRFTSKDGSTLIAVAAPGPAKDAKMIHREAIAAIDQDYAKVEVLDRVKRSKLGSRPATAAVLNARAPRSRKELRILVATARGEKRAYLVEVFTAGTSALVEAQVLLNNLRLKG